MKSPKKKTAEKNKKTKKKKKTAEKNKKTKKKKKKNTPRGAGRSIFGVN